MSTNRKQPIDPICAMCRLSLLNFKEVNTKIGIGGHAINVQGPSVLQNIFRRYNGDGREDIFELFYLISHIIVWFLDPSVRAHNMAAQHEDHPKDCTHDEKFLTDLKQMVSFMLLGLKQLQTTYKSGLVVIALQCYINWLNSGLNGTFDTKQLPACLIEEIGVESPLRTKIVELWDYTRLHRVCAIFADCFDESKKNSKIKDELIYGYISSIEKILSTYEKEFINIIETWG
jgi:hypothetical protein